MAHKMDAANCVACGSFKDACPADAILEGDPSSLDPENCVDCGACASTCPNNAISAA